MITIKQFGDYRFRPEEILHRIDGYLSNNTTQLMFLKQYDSSPYSAVNPIQGIIEIKNGQIFYSSHEYSLFGNNSYDLVIDLIKTSLSDMNKNK